MPEKKTTLQGEHLRAFLTKASDLLDEGTNSNISIQERQAAVIELMQQHQLLPHTWDELLNLYRLWHIELVQPQEGLAVLQTHRSRVLHSLAADERQRVEIRLTLKEIRALQDIAEETANAVLLQQAKVLLKTTALQLHALPRNDYSRYRWEEWCDYALAGNQWDIFEWALDSGFPVSLKDQTHWWNIRETQNSQAFLFHYTKADWAFRRDDAMAVRGHFAVALQELQKVADEQAIEWEKWSQLAEWALEAVPEQVENLLHQGMLHCARQDDPVSLPRQRSRLVQASCLMARISYQRGDLAAALRWAKRGFFTVNEVIFDHEEFLLFWLECLQQAGDWKQITEVVLYWTLNGERQTNLFLRFWQLANELVDDNSAHSASAKQTCETRMMWALVLASFYQDAGIRKLLRREGINMPKSEEEQEQKVLYWLDRAREQVPAHPLISVLEGWHLFRAKSSRWKKALPLLEQLCALPQYASDDFLAALWTVRFKVLGTEQALLRPFAPSKSAVWCKQFAVRLDKGLLELKKKPSIEAVQSLLERYQNEAIQRFENFFQNGEGSFEDANLVSYAELCKVLGDRCYKQQNYERAQTFYRKGLAAGEYGGRNLIWHWQGVLQVALKQGDNQSAIDVAENIWHLACSEENLFLNFAMNSYAADIAIALQQLNRHHEIFIWLDRLQQWFEDRIKYNRQCSYSECTWEEHFTDEKQSVHVYMLKILSMQAPDEALELLSTQLPGIYQISRIERLCQAAEVFMKNAKCAEHWRQAAELYNRALMLLDRQGSQEELLKEQIKKHLASCRMQ